MDSVTERYRTIVADPPWELKKNTGTWPPGAGNAEYRAVELEYPTLSISEIKCLPVSEWAERDSHLYLWTTQRYLPTAFDVVGAWGFSYAAMLVWSKPPKGIAGTFVCSAEYVLFCRRGSLAALSRHMGSVFHWPRTGRHSTKPEAFLDVVEQVSPGPYLELFARRNRLGWDSWGDEALNHVELAS